MYPKVIVTTKEELLLFETERTLVKKSTWIIEAVYSLNPVECALFTYVIAQMKPSDPIHTEYKIYISDIARLSGNSNNHDMYGRIDRITDSMMGQFIKIATEGGKKGFKKFSYFSSAEYEVGSGYVIVTIDSKLRPYLLDFKRGYTEYDEVNLYGLFAPRYPYAFRIYEWLKSFERKGHMILHLEDIHLRLELPPSYAERYSEFKKKIILKSQKLIRDNTDIQFTFRELKQDKQRAITHLEFFITAQPIPHKNHVVLAIKPLTTLVPDGSEAHLLPQLQPKHLERPELLGQRLSSNFGISQSQSAVLLASYSPEHISAALDYVATQLPTGKVKNIPAYTVKCIHEGAAILETEHEKKRRQHHEAAQKELKAKEIKVFKEKNDRERYEQGLLAECERFLLDHDLEVIAREFQESLDAFWRQHIVKPTVSYSEYLKNRQISGKFKDYIALHYLSAEWHSFEAWQNSIT